MRVLPVLLTLACAGAPSDGVVDADQDGFSASKDCNDLDASSFPGANEFCDGVDNDCNGQIDDDALGARSWRPDVDGDGYYDPAGVAIEGCEQPDGYAVIGGDCDDSNPDVHPGVRDICDEIDNDCDDVVDEDPETFQYEDLDGDGYGVSKIALRACPGDPLWSPIGGDCDDSDDAINPNRLEICNGVDDDCNGVADDDDDPLDPIAWYPDLDGDGYGADAPLIACDPGSGWVQFDGDCLDTDSSVSPGALELCGNEIDDDCDTLIDGQDSCV